ncbi:hypothetical protein KC909_05185 [Candidatus Dojkabacteria bacterium]|uniref:Uncharacterized protein n=1 Tax=Candidatus Dojkabacteria bacterium TaxID=2099670 RepID=A0A955L6D7_9BACT|nr:hypothetical protein [Candidatus Dojkabacteria bacterium]
MNKKREPKSAKDILMDNDFLSRFTDRKHNVSKEFQDYGLRLSQRLNDEEHKALYIKLAKSVPRKYLEAAASFAIDYPNVPKKGRIFMWKLKEVCKEDNYKMSFPRKAKKKKAAKKKKTTNQISMF